MLMSNSDTSKADLDQTEVAPVDQPPVDIRPEEAAADMDAVLVVKSVTEDGTIQTQVSHLGNVQPTEVQTLLELGVKSWRARIGL